MVFVKGFLFFHSDFYEWLKVRWFEMKMTDCVLQLFGAIELLLGTSSRVAGALEST